MSCRYNNRKAPNHFARLHQKLAKIEKDLQDAASNVTKADPRDEEMSIDTMLREKVRRFFDSLVLFIYLYQSIYLYFIYLTNLTKILDGN